MEKKITKKDYFRMLKEVVERADVENAVELTEFIDRQVELLAKKTSGKTKTQKENEVYAETVYEVLARVGRPVTVTELNAEAELAEYSNQKLTALLRILVKAERVVRVEDKKKTFYSIAE